jgi:hypothetical protein
MFDDASEEIEESPEFEEEITVNNILYRISHGLWEYKDDPTPVVLFTNCSSGKMYALLHVDKDWQTNELTELVICRTTEEGIDNSLLASNIFPPELREKLAEHYAIVAQNEGMYAVEEVLEQLRAGEAVLKARPREQRQQDAEATRVINGTNFDGDIADIVAAERLNMLLETLHATDDPEEKATLVEQIAAAQAQQAELEQAASALKKPKGHPVREVFEGKDLGNTLEGKAKEDSHVMRLLGRDINETGWDGPSR